MGDINDNGRVASLENESILFYMKLTPACRSTLLMVLVICSAFLALVTATYNRFPSSELSASEISYKLVSCADISGFPLIIHHRIP